MTNTHDEHEDELKESQDQIINKLKEENRNHELEELVERKIKEETGSFKEELKEHSESLEKKMKLYLGIAFGFLTLCAFVLHYLGKDEIHKVVKESISNDAKPKIDALVENETHIADSIIRTRADSLVGKLVNTKADTLIHTLINEKGDVMMKEVRAEMEEKFKKILDSIFENEKRQYNQKIAGLKRQKINPENPIPKEVKKDLSKANELLVKINKEEPDYSFDDWYIKGVGEYEKNDKQQALNSFSKALDKNPASADAYRYRGNIHSELSQYDKAIEDYNKAFGLNPGTAVSYYNRGLCYFNLKQYLKAIADYDEAIKLKYDYAKAYNNRGLAYYGLQQYEKAIKDYDKAIKIDPQYAGAFNNRGIAYEVTGRKGNAKDDHDKAHKLDPEKY